MVSTTTDERSKKVNSPESVSVAGESGTTQELIYRQIIQD